VLHRWSRLRLVLPLLATAISLGGTVARAATLTQEAFANLSRGGFVVLLRHGMTDEGPGFPEDKSPLDLANCADQAALNAGGRAQAGAIGAAFAGAGIPVGKVLASGYCRALEMGRLAFGRAEASDALLLRAYVPVAGAPAPPAWPQRVAMLKTLLATPPDLLPAAPPAPTNTILITHFPNIKAALGLDIDFGGAVIVRPSGTGDTRLVARIAGDEWGTLGKADTK
jgi:hypothetical protein